MCKAKAAEYVGTGTAPEGGVPPVPRLAPDGQGKYGNILRPRIASFPRGTRLTPKRADKLKFGAMLTDAEKDVFREMLFRREGALAWTFREKGRIANWVEPPHVINTVPHKPWRARDFRKPAKLLEKEKENVQERLDLGLFEYCKGPYRNPAFLVEKKTKGTYLFIISVVKANEVTMRDVGLPPNVEEFAEAFAGYLICTLMDFFAGYEQVTLAEESRNLMACSTSLGLVRPTTLVQGATNSVATFVRVGRKILKDHIRKTAEIFVDDVGIRGPKTRYNDEEVPGLPGVRRFVLEHIRNVEIALFDIELANGSISGEKSEWGGSGISIVGYVCDENGRYPQESKIRKIERWLGCKNVKEVRAFLGICVYYRIWIPNFALIAAPLFKVLKKNVVFDWTEKHSTAMRKMKDSLLSAPALVTIDFSPDAGKIIVAVDASLEG